MTTSEPNPPAPNSRQTLAQDSPSAGPLPGWLAARPWVTPVVPFVVFMLLGTLEPTPEKPFEFMGFSIPYSSYPLVYTLKVALTFVAMLAVSAGYRQFAWRVSPLAFVVGAVGAVVWVALCKLALDRQALTAVGLDSMLGLGERSGYDPFANIPDRPMAAWGFLAIRFLGLVIIVPVIEEFFLRVFAMRFVIDQDWWKVPFGTLTPLAVGVGTVLPMLMHPGELLAAALWFSAITWLMWKTKNIWDCVVAHAVTNLLMGVWVVTSGDWFLM